MAQGFTAPQIILPHEAIIAADAMALADLWQATRELRHLPQPPRGRTPPYQRA